MNGILQRPAPNSANVQRVGDILELRWRPRVAARQKVAPGRRRGRRHKRQAGTRDFLETLAVLVTLAVLAAATYIYTPGGFGL